MDIQERMAKALELLGNAAGAIKEQRGCETGKGKYPTQQLAKIAVKKYAKRSNLHGARLETYHCKLCGFWHLTKRD